MSADWNRTALDILRRLWAADWSAKMIADALNRQFGGGDFTRNAVIGKAARLGLPGRPSPVVRKDRAPETRPRAPYQRRDADGALKVSDRPKGPQGRKVNNPGGIRNAMLSRQALRKESGALHAARVAAGMQAAKGRAVAVNPFAEPINLLATPAPRAVPQTGGATTLAEITAHQCRWIEGAPLGAASVCCGEPVAAVGEPYCTAHRKRAWSGKPELRERAA